jgi:hypothetical protein
VSRSTEVSPLAALDSQVSLVRALANPSIGAEIMGGAQGLPGAEQALQREGKYLARVMREALDTAPTIVVTDHMLDLVLARLDRLDLGEPLQPEDLSLFPSGYVVFPRPVIVPDVVAEDAFGMIPPRMAARFDAGFWMPSSIVARGTANMLNRRGIGVEPTPLDIFDESLNGIMYTQSVSVGLAETILTTDHDAGVISQALDWESIKHGIARLRSVGVKHAPIYSSGWAFGLSWDPEQREDDYVLTPAGEFERRFWLTLWRTMAEEVMAPVTVPRADRRRAARMLSQVPEVVVADLRRVKHPVTHERLADGAEVMWSHRWKVRGHQRVLHRGTDRERTVWVREYVKGPESAPLIEKDTVWRLRR